MFNKETFQTFQKNKCRTAAIFLVFLSLIFFLTMLIGSTTGGVYLNKFTFDQTISEILQRKSITFTLLGYCIDDNCTKDVAHNFDKAPTSGEIQSGAVKKRSVLDPGGISSQVGNAASNVGNAVGDAGNKVGDAANNAGNAVGDAGEKAGGVANSAGDKAGEIAGDVGKAAGDAANSFGKAAVNTLLSAFDNFLPKEPTNGKSGWIARPIIAASVFNTLTLFLLLIINDKNGKYCRPLALTFVIISFILNITSYFITFSLFSLVFNVIGAFPGIGKNNTGAAIYLSGWSSALLFISLILIIIDGSREKLKDLKSKVSKESKESKEFEKSEESKESDV